LDPDGLRDEFRGNIDTDTVTQISHHLTGFEQMLLDKKLPNGTNYAGKTIVSVRLSVQSFYSYTFGVKFNVSTGTTKQNKRPKHIPTRLELRKMLDCCKLRDKTLILMQASTGMRARDLLKTRVGDIDNILVPKQDTMRYGTSRKKRTGR
jgi:integrase